MVEPENSRYLLSKIEVSERSTQNFETKNGSTTTFLSAKFFILYKVLKRVGETSLKDD